MESPTPPIPTPPFVRWQRAQHRLVPALAVLLCATLAWRLWLDAPRTTAIGQVFAGDHGLTIQTYVRSEQRTRPVAGMAVEVRQRADAARTFHGAVERVGQQYEAVPAAQLRDRRTEEWGLPVFIPVPAGMDLKPGELVYVGWRPTPPAGS